MNIKALSKWLLIVNVLFLVLSIAAPLAFAQSLPQGAQDSTGAFGSAGPSDIVNTFYQGTQGWLTGMQGPAQTLFWALAGIDFTWTCITLVLQHQDLYSWMGGFVRKILSIGFFAVLLQNGAAWISDIVNFFINLGSSVGGRSVSGLSASGIMVSGIQLATHMLHSAASATQTGAITNSISLMISGPSAIGTTLLLILGAVFMVGAYVVIALHYVMAMVEAYVTVGTGYIFLGFGGSRWTVPYTEKYLGMVVAAGVRIMVLELLIGLGSTLYPQWNQMALKISAIPDLIDGGTVGGQWTGVQLEAALVSSIAIYGLLCWMIPRLASNVVQGGLSMSGGDVIAGGAAVASTGMAAASLMTSSSQSSSKAVADVAQAAAMTGVQMGMQTAMATASGGSSVAVTAAASGVQGIGSNPAGAAVSSASVDGFTPLPPGLAGGGVNVAPPADGSGAGQGEVAMTGLDGGANTGTPLAGPSLAEDPGSNSIAGAPSPIEQAEIATVPDETRESPQVPTSGSKLGGVMNTLKTVVNEAEQAIKRMPDGGGHVGGTTPKVDHGE